MDPTSSFAVLKSQTQFVALGDELLRAMRGSKEPCTLAPGGCTIIGETLDQVASSLLGGLRSRC
jgi:hypothetical protein